MSELEQRLYFSLAEKDRRVFNVKDIVCILDISEFHARNIASSLVKKGAVERIKPGLFSRVPENIIQNKKLYHEDAIMIATMLCDPYYISHFTALVIHGLANRYSDTVYISSPIHQRDLDYHDNFIKFIGVNPERMFGIESRSYFNEEIKVSDLERTLLDIINRPLLSGGWIEVIDSIKNIDEIDEKRLIDHIRKFDNKKTARITGYFLENIDNVELSEKIKNDIGSFSGTNKYYIDRSTGGSLDREWELIVPDNIRRELNDK